MPIALPSTSPGPVRFGPRTAPTVVAHTTIERSRPREASVARSAAAKRDCRLAAWPAPMMKKPTSSSGNAARATAMITSPTPTRATAMPVVSDRRRPRRRAIAASGTAVSAVPNVTAAAASPEKASSPEMSAASTAPSDSVAPKASPPSTWPSESTQTVRRWTAATSSAVVPLSVLTPTASACGERRPRQAPRALSRISSPVTRHARCCAGCRGR